MIRLKQIAWSAGPRRRAYASERRSSNVPACRTVIPLAIGWRPRRRNRRLSSSPAARGSSAAGARSSCCAAAIACGRRCAISPARPRCARRSRPRSSRATGSPCWPPTSTPTTGWAEAVEGCEYVLHVASPFPPTQPKDPDELIVPAREGTLRVLRASLDAGVERVVVTSSVAAVTGGRERPSRPLDERDWSDPDNPKLSAYARSKTIAERAAWDLARERGATGPAGGRQPGRDRRPGAERGPLLLPAGDRAAAARHAGHAADRLQPRRRARRRRPRAPGDDGARGRRRALRRGRPLSLDGGGRRDPARAPRQARREGAHPQRPRPARAGRWRSSTPASAR